MPSWGWAGAMTDAVSPNLVFGLGGLGKDVANVPLNKTPDALKAFSDGLLRAGERWLQDNVGKTMNDFIATVPKEFIKAGLGLGDSINGLEQSIADLIAKFDQSQKIVSPIVLDLNGDGLTTTAVGSGTYFDHNANGFAENTGWVNAQDGILVRDLNGNGTIDSGRELFGSETLLANGSKAANGYEALAELDTNQDGQINAQDTSAASLKIWKDTNGDGISQAGELFTLAAAGVQSIATGSTAVNQIDANGNTIKQTGTYTKADGSTGTSADIWFERVAGSGLALTHSLRYSSRHGTTFKT